MVRYLILFSVFYFLLSPVFALTYEVVQVGRSRLVAYSSEHRQTDHDPFSTATGTTPKWGTVAANHLLRWSRIKIEGFGEKVFTVEDRLHNRYKNTIDIWYPTKKQAKKFGVRWGKYWVLKNVHPLPD